jgi:3-oxoacyl-[acyl-carrier-protein] synthase II
VLESREHADRRGAKSLARIAGFGTRSQTTADWSTSGDAICRTIRATLASAGMQAEDLSHVNAHGLSTREDDPIEARAIRDELGEIPVTAPKSFFGNLGQGGGMVELAVSILALEHGMVPPTLNYETPDPECPVNVVAEMQPTDKSAFIKLNQNPSGQSAAVVVEKVE